jgi:hypothetical protein
MGLRRLPRAKLTSQVDDLYHILIAHWVWHRVVFADEIQRLLLATGILLAGVSGCRLVSLFDTRVKIDNDEAKDDRDSHDKLDSDNFTDSDTTPMNSMNMEDYAVLNSQGELDDSKVSDSECGTDTEPNTHSDADMDNDKYNETDSEASSEVEGDLDCYLENDLFNETDTESGADDDLNWNSNDSSVTDDEYDTGVEETRTILWRHIAFHIIPSPVKGRPNILMAKLTLLHTKGEDRKPRV